METRPKKLQDAVYQAAALCAMSTGLNKRRGNGTPPFIFELASRLVRTIWAEKPVDSVLRKFVISVVAQSGNGDDYEHFGSEGKAYPGGFGRDIMVGLGRAKGVADKGAEMVFLEREGAGWCRSRRQ
jgi:hypothetical protein